MFVKFKLKKQGALTSKTYEFKARNWELKSSFSFDIFHSEGSFILLEYRNIEILRIIPRYGIQSSVWITDKLRFFYSNLKYNRLLKPFYNSFFFKWKTFSNLLIKSIFRWILKIYSNSILMGNLINLRFNLASFNIDFLDLQYYSHFQRLLSKFFKCGSNFYKMYDFIEFQNYTLNSNLLFEHKSLICLGINFRNEFPFLEVKIKNRIFFDSLVLINFCAGGGYFNYFNYVYSNFYDFTKFVQGKLFLNCVNSLILANNYFSILGRSFCNYLLLKKYVTKLKLKSVTSEILKMNCYEVGFFDNNLYFDNIIDMNFIFESTTFLSKLSNQQLFDYVKLDFVTSLSGWGSAHFKKNIFNLPVPVVSEYNFFGFTFYGYLKKSYKIFKFPVNCKRVRQYILFFLVYSHFKNVFTLETNNFISVLKKYISYKQFINLELLNKFYFLGSLFIYNFFYFKR